MRLGFGVGERSRRFLRSRDLERDPADALRDLLSRRREIERERREFSLSPPPLAASARDDVLAGGASLSLPFFSGSFVEAAAPPFSPACGEADLLLRLRRSAPLDDDELLLELDELLLELDELEADERLDEELEELRKIKISGLRLFF